MKHANTTARLLVALVLGLAATVSLPACKRAGVTTPPSPSASSESATTPTASTVVLPVISVAPAWQLTTLDGKAISSEQLKGKVVVVDFWATWCGPCVHEIPGYIALQKKYAEQGLVIVGVSVDQQGAGVVTKFNSDKGVNYPVALATPEIIAAFGGIEGIPTTFLIDREGRLRHHKVGAMATADYEALIASVL
jgi:thiol-disulfide isomerase/thioredoxin